MAEPGSGRVTERFWRTRARGVLRLLRSAPRWPFHAVLAVAALGLLWGYSVPGSGDLFLFFGVAWVLTCAAVIWSVRLVAFWLHRRRGSWWFAVAPVGAVLVWTLISLEVPLTARWAASRGAFETVVRDLPPASGTGWQAVDVPERIGAYRLTAAHRVPGGVIFSEATGDFFGDAGFAYLPNGPSASLENGSFESPTFKHLGGPWYAWTASW